MKLVQSIFTYLCVMVLFAIIPVTAQHNGYADWLVPNFWLMFFFISLLTIMILISLLIVQNKNPDYYAPTFLAGTTIKILACLVFIFVYISKNKVDKYVFLADFFYVYLLNMAFEVYILLRNLRHKNLR